MKFLPSKIRQPKLVLGLCTVIVLFMALTLVYSKGRKANPAPAVQESSVVTYSTDNPSEEKPGNGYKWSGRPEEPKYIRLSTIQTEGFIQTVGVDQHTQIAVPNNIHVAGWFKDSVRPGEKGLSIIDGHVDGRSTGGIFRQLGNLKPEDEFTIELGDGSVKKYRVKKLSTIDVAVAANELFSQDPQIESQLNLITCGGTFDKQSRQYNKRVIVAAELVKK